MGNALNAIQEGGISGLKTFVKKAKEGKRIDKTIDKLTNISKSLSDNPENFDLGKTTDALAKTVVPELPNMMKGVKDKVITPFVEMGQKSLAMPFSMESGIGNPNERAIVDNMVTKSKEAMPALDKAIADAEQLKKDQENKAGIFAPQNMNNDNSTTNINNTKNITPIIAANQNGSYNNVGKGNMAFR
jgi:hypothetical protein